MNTKRERALAAVGTVFQVIDCVLLAACVLLALGVLVKSIRLETVSLDRIYLHGFLLVGFAAFFFLFLFPRARGNTRWMMSFTHEFTHLVFAILFFRKIHRFNVDARDSHVSFSSGWLGYTPITLSPYCIPIFTLALLPWRFTTGNGFFLSVIDILIGFTFAFHICCWAGQIRLHQTDITGPGTVRSLLFITFFILVSLSLVMLTPSSGVQLALQRVFWDFPQELVRQFLVDFHFHP